MARNLLYSNDKRSGYPSSWYAATALTTPECPSLADSVSCDICIVGAGFTGLSAALCLLERGYNVVLLDAHRVGWGASGRNGGQLGSGQRLDQSDLEAAYGMEQAMALWKLAENAKQLVSQLIEQHNIDCDYVPGIIHADHKPGFASSTKAYVEKLTGLYNYKEIEYIDRPALGALIGSDAYYCGSVDRGSGHLHPLKYVLGLANAATNAGLHLYERSEVVGVSASADNKRVVVKTAAGQVTAQQVLLGCNGYLGNLQPKVAAHVMPINNYIIATEPLPQSLYETILPENMAVADSRFVVNYFRKSADRRLLFGGRESYGYQFPEDIKSFVRTAMLAIYPQLDKTKIDYGWGGTLAITMNRMPYLKTVAPNVVSASGYSGHGVGMATLAGRLAAESMAGNLERFDVLSQLRHRKFPGGVALRSPLMKLGMLYYMLRDRL
ncbi:oxidoreductase [Chromatiales bacterium (ex Bugula neritina AB1)]|nr:oxidoreductase [Chromatiales bacterium (ex Bugula neritina AB1)]